MLDLPQNTFWGGGMAAELMNNYLIPYKFILYTAQPFHEVMKTLKIIPDAKGNIFLIEKFWKGNMYDKRVHEYLVYADLIASGNPREIEAATKIYNEYIKNSL